jgi:enoyl-CoA hydratase/carnithine racemase
MGEVITELCDGVLTVTLHRPGRLNALSLSQQRELAGLWARVRRDAGVRCIVVTGSGRAFCAGADVADLAAMTAPAGGDRGRIEFCPGACVDVPVIAAVNGPCLGAGLRLLADADLAIASDLAWFSDPHVSIGQLGTPVALALAEKCSAAAVAQLFLSGSGFRMSASQALSAGLVSEVVPVGELGPRVSEIAVGVAAQSPAAIRATVAALRRRQHAALAPQLTQAWADVARQQAHPDAAEGARALVEKRPAQWCQPQWSQPCGSGEQGAP